MYIETLERRNDKNVTAFCVQLAQQFKPHRIDDSRFEILKSFAKI